jgi:hypothetical protein
MPTTDVTVELWYSAAWHDITSYVYLRDDITITRGQTALTTRTPPSTLNMTLDNRTGRFSPRNPNSPLYGLIGRNTPVRVLVDGLERVTGEMEAWPTRWAIKGDVWSPVTATGVLRRLNAPGTTQRAWSPVRRLGIYSPVVAAYWPMESYTAEPALVASAVSGIIDARIRLLTPTVASPLDWGADATLVGSGPLPVLESNRTSLAGIEANFTVSPDPALGLAFWTRTYIPKTDQSHSINTQTILTTVLNNGANGLSLVLVCYPPGSTLASVPADGEVIVRASYTVNGVPTQNVDITDIPYVDGWRHALVRFATSGSNVAVSVRLDGTEVGTGTFTTVSLADITRATFNFFEQDVTGTESARLAAGHPMVLAGTTADMDTVAGYMPSAGNGYAGESAYNRLGAVCFEEGITLTVVGDTDPSQLVGVQRLAPFTDLLQDAVDVDLGVLYESRDLLDVAYRTGRSLYNQDPVVDLTYGAAGEVAAPLTPVDDTSYVVNDVTVTRYAGSSAHAEQLTGPLNTEEPSDDPDGVGRYAQDVTLVLAEDTQCIGQATWRVHLGTVDEARYPVINVDMTALELAGKTSLRSDCALLDIGDRIRITDPPSWLPPEDIDQVVLGYTETIGNNRWTIALNCVPYRPFNTGAVGTARVATGGSQTNEAMDTTETGMDVISTTYRWIDSATYASAFPFDVMVGGERMTVTALTGTGLTQVMTVTRSVNGVVKTHTIGTPIQVVDPPVVAL